MPQPVGEFPNFSTENSNFTPAAKDSSQKEKESIFVAWEQRLDASAPANIQPAATKVTNIDSFSFWERLPCLRQLYCLHISEAQFSNKILFLIQCLFQMVCKTFQRIHFIRF